MQLRFFGGAGRACRSNFFNINDKQMKIAIIGAGNMGGAIARGLAARVASVDICVSNPSAGKLDALKQEFPAINITTDNCAAVCGADFVFLAVKPWKMEEVIAQIKPSLCYEKQIVVSVAGGVGSAQIDSWLAKEGEELPPLYIIIPNTAIATGCSMTFVCGKRTLAAADEKIAQMFSTMGEVMFVDEGLVGAGTALASCGIAYALRYIRAAVEGGVELGFRAADAQKIVMQTLKGAVSVLAANGTHPEVEIDRVTTPGGLTIKGLNAMEEAGFTASVIEGLRASVKK